MSLFAEPFRIVALSVAALWPVAAGLALVLWTRARAAERRRRAAAIETGLQGMFHAVENQPVPGRLELVVDALEEQAAIGAPAKPRPVRRGRKATPTS